MIAGTIRDAVNQMQLKNKWEQKKSSGNVLKKEKSNVEMSQEERMIQDFQKQLEQDRESSAYSQIYNKIASGQDLTPEEEEQLRQKDPRTYSEYKADKMEQEAYERKLRECKTKEEAQRLQVNKMNGKLAELKNIVNNPNIPKGEKMKEAQRIMGDTYRTAKIFNEFTSSKEFQDLPTDEELAEETKADTQAESEKSDVAEIQLEHPEEQDETVHEPDDDTKSEIKSNEVSDDIKSEIKFYEMSEDIKSKVQSYEVQKNVQKPEDISQLENVHKLENDVLKEMRKIEEKHFGKRKSSVGVDVTV